MRKLCVSDVVLSLGLSLAALLAVIPTLAITFRPLDVVVIVSLLIAVYSLLAVFKWVAFGLVGASLLFLLFAWKSSVVGAFVNFLGSYVLWAWGYLSSPFDDPGSVYLRFTLVVLCLLVSLPFFLLVRNNAHVVLVAVAGAALFYLQQAMGFGFPALYFALFLMLAILYAVRQALPNNAKRERMLWISLPVCFFVLFAAMKMPVSEEPAGRHVVSAVNRVTARFPAWLSIDWGSGPFAAPGDGSVVDYAEVSENLGGSVSLGDVTVLYVRGEVSPYLKSRTYTTYTGRGWLTEAVQVSGETGMLDAETYQGRMLFYNSWNSMEMDYERFPYENWQAPMLLMTLGESDDAAAPEDIYVTQRISVHYGDLTTDKIFSPPWAVGYRVANEFRHNTVLYKQENSDIFSSRTLKRDFSYTVDTVRPNVTPEELTSLYGLSYPGLWRSVAALISPVPEAVTAFAAYSEYVEELYGDVSLTPRTQELAREIVSGSRSTYDRALAIEQYLRDNYTYETNPAALPEDADFVDHFLFEGREGYCTYFATAMTTLCRAVGIPARYVVGYAPATEKRDEYYVVTGRQAHAWTEVYLEGVGWVPFEPTATYSSEGIRSGQTGGGAVAPVATPSREPSPPLPDISPNADPGIVRPTATPEASGEDGAPRPISFWGIAAAALVAWVIAQAIRRRLFLRRIKGAGFDSAGATLLYGRLKRFVFFLGMRQTPSETQLEFGRRVDGRFLDLYSSMQAAAQVHEKISFGNREPSEEDQRELLRSFERVESLASYKLGWKLVPLRYIAGLI